MMNYEVFKKVRMTILNLVVAVEQGVHTLRDENATLMCLVLILMFASLGLAEDTGVERRVDPVQQAKTAASLVEYLGRHIDLLGESVARRYRFGQAPELRQSVQDALMEVEIADVFRKDGTVHWAPLLKTALGGTLDEGQLQAYQASIEARETRDKQAAAVQMIACVDQHLSLTPGQRAKAAPELASLLRDAGMTAQALMIMDTGDIMDLGARLALDSNHWQGVLSPLQVRILVLTPSKRNERGWRGHDADPDEREERIRLITTAKLSTHTEQLGDLDARASRRLTLATKGVVEQVLESQGMDRRRDHANALDAAGRINRNPREGPQPALSSAVDSLNHPLYQRTIKDVLSEEAYARYQTYQAERLALRDRALRDLIVAYLDTRLLLSETQRQSVAETLAKMPVPPKADGRILLVPLIKQIDQTDLSPGQRREFGAILRERARWGG